MSFNAVKEECWPLSEICDIECSTLGLKQEHMQLFEQQNHQYSTNYGANNDPLEWSNQVPEFVASLGFSSHASHEHPGYAYPYMSPPESGFQAPQVMYKNGSVSTVSSPSVGVAHVPQQAPGDVNSPTSEEKDTKRKPRKKPFLDDKEAALMEKDDSELNDEELQMKKKAQNRLAQRAFRERKETKLKELESKLLQSEEERQKLLEKLDEIKLQYISVRTENTFLRSGSEAQPSFGKSANLDGRFVFPKSQDEFVDTMIDTTQHVINTATINKVYEEPRGRKVLAVGAVWDYLQIKSEEEEYEGVDLFEVMQLLRGNEACHGYGPAYPLELVDAALARVKELSNQ